MRKVRRRRRRQFNWTGFLWLLALANIAAGLAWSPATSVKRVRVVGAAPADRVSISDAAQTMRNVPCLRANPKLMETLVLASDEVEDAAFSQNLFGRGLLKVKNHRPVAAVSEHKSLLLASNGDVYQTKQPAPALPVAKLPPEAFGPNTCLCGGWESGQIAELCALLVTQLPNLDWSVAVDRRGVISLGCRTGGQVILGSSEGLSDKVRRLRQQLQVDPQLLSKVKVLNLTAPNHPVFIPRPPAKP